MEWLKLGIEIARLGAPLLGAVVAGTPAAPIIETLITAFGASLQPTVPVDPCKLKEEMLADANAADKVKQIETNSLPIIQEVAQLALPALITKLL